MSDYNPPRLSRFGTSTHRLQAADGRDGIDNRSTVGTDADAGSSAVRGSEVTPPMSSTSPITDESESTENGTNARQIKEVQMHFRIEEHARDSAKENTERGEISEALRQTVYELAYPEAEIKTVDEQIAMLAEQTEGDR